LGKALGDALIKMWEAETETGTGAEAEAEAQAQAEAVRESSSPEL